MKVYIKSATSIKNGSYLLTKDGEMIPVFFHAPSTTYEARKIYHLCPTDANFLYNQNMISKEDAKVVLKYCFAEYLDGSEGSHEIDSSDINEFASYADLMGAPWLYEVACDLEGVTVDDLIKDSKEFDKLNDKWYSWLKDNLVKVTVHNNKVEFRIGSNNGFDWNDVIIDEAILKSNLKDDPAMRFNILRESDKGYKAYFQNATLNDILEDDKKVLSSDDIISTTILGGKQMGKWNYTLKAGKILRSAINSGDMLEVLDGLERCWAEINLKYPDEFSLDDLTDVTDEIDVQRDNVENYEDYDMTYDDVEAEIDYLLADLYDFCDALGIWVELDY